MAGRLLIFLLSLTAASAEVNAEAPRPHVVFLLADDLGFGDVGWHGSEIRTPHLDALAASGTKLERFYVQPVCSPTRASLMTGRYPMRYGLQVGVIRPHERRGLSLAERLLPQALHDFGYATHMVGMTGAMARRDLAWMMPRMRSESRTEETSGLVTISASSAKVSAITAPRSIPAGESQTT